MIGKIEIKFNLGETVSIKELGKTKGVVVLIVYGTFGIQYEVRYFNAGIRYSLNFFDFELEAIS